MTRFCQIINLIQIKSAENGLKEIEISFIDLVFIQTKRNLNWSSYFICYKLFSVTFLVFSIFFISPCLPNKAGWGMISPLAAWTPALKFCRIGTRRWPSKGLRGSLSLSTALISPMLPGNICSLNVLLWSILIQFDHLCLFIICGCNDLKYQTKNQQGAQETEWTLWKHEGGKSMKTRKESSCEGDESVEEWKKRFTWQ